MNSVKLMNEEHENIKRMLKVVRAICKRILEGQEIPYEAFKEILKFLRGYADEHHHGKEEKMFFNEMVEHLGSAAEKLVTHGMLVEHDMGRLFLSDLESALERVKAGDDESRLDVIANAISYTHLLARHIEKEDGVVFPFAERSFSEDKLDEINKAFEVYEEKKTNEGIQALYLDILKRLELNLMA